MWSSNSAFLAEYPVLHDGVPVRILFCFLTHDFYLSQQLVIHVDGKIVGTMEVLLVIHVYFFMLVT